jgi:hypothetical protein
MTARSEWSDNDKVFLPGSVQWSRAYGGGSMTCEVIAADWGELHPAGD